VLTAAFGYINHRYIKMPQTIGIMIMSLVTSLVIIAINWIDPALFLKPVQIIKSLDFYTLLMKIMLSFLLFAGSLHLDAHRFKKHALSIFTFSTIGVIISTFLVGLLFYFAAGLFNLHITFIEALLFGALISPTDPIAVLGILRQANIPASLEIKITGESLLTTAWRSWFSSPFIISCRLAPKTFQYLALGCFFCGKHVVVYCLASLLAIVVTLFSNRSTTIKPKR
jgi:CPA1 family monovalent cation:H+ antiporter